MHCFNLINCLKQGQPRNLNILTSINGASHSKKPQISKGQGWWRLKYTDQKFETSVGYMASSRLAQATQWDPSHTHTKKIKVILASKYFEREKVNIAAVEAYRATTGFKQNLRNRYTPAQCHSYWEKSWDRQRGTLKGKPTGNDSGTQLSGVVVCPGKYT